MNYIKELNAFRDYVLQNDLSTGEIALWHTLMLINNMSGWKEWFSAPNPTLQQMTGLSKSGLDKIRNQLCQKGLIEYQKGKKKHAGLYRMVPLSTLVHKLVHHVDLSEDNQETNPRTIGEPTVDEKWPKSGPYLNKTKTKLNETNNTDDDDGGGLPQSRAVEFFTINFGNFSEFIITEILNWVDQLSEDVVIAAMKLALKRNAKNFGYVESILKEWHSQGLKTIDQVRAYESARKEKQAKSKTAHRPNERVDRLPKWATGGDLTKNDMQPDDIQKREKELDAILSGL
ncbi:DnaD domain-containing protein [Caenibacillus caldisaponilyticus]|uniref:DnaD domain-containing protein n=1 Tax=Caenibacillus caldisaponilyticus TaxID=1674942 RepID=UPI0009885290|nr:DnaD domain protein [Caenibacillus caldisaponilyticus]